MNEKKIVVSDVNRVVAANLVSAFYVARASGRFENTKDGELMGQIAERYADLAMFLQDPLNRRR